MSAVTSIWSRRHRPASSWAAQLGEIQPAARFAVMSAATTRRRWARSPLYCSAYCGGRRQAQVPFHVLSQSRRYGSQDAHVLTFGENGHPAAGEDKCGGALGYFPVIHGCGGHSYFTRTDAASDAGVQRRSVLASLSGSRGRDRRQQTSPVRELGRGRGVTARRGPGLQGRLGVVQVCAA